MIHTVTLFFRYIVMNLYLLLSVLTVLPELSSRITVRAMPPSRQCAAQDIQVIGAHRHFYLVQQSFAIDTVIYKRMAACLTLILIGAILWVIPTIILALTIKPFSSVV